MKTKKNRRIFCAFFATLMLLTNFTIAAGVSDKSNGNTNGNYNHAMDAFIADMFEKPGYQIFKGEHVDIAEEFYAAMTQNYQNGNFEAISDYMRVNQISVLAPLKIIDIYETSPNLRSDVIGARRVVRQGLISVKDESTNATNQIWYELIAVIGYNRTQNKIISANEPQMSYDFAYQYDVSDDDKSFIPDDDATEVSFTSQKANYQFGVDAFVTIVDDSIFFIPLKYHFRADGTETITVSDVLN